MISMVRQTPALLMLVVLISACATSGGPAPSEEREWSALEKDYQWIETLRRSAPAPDPTAPRKAQIEAMLDSHRKIDPVLVPFLERLRAYYDRTGDQRAAAIWAHEKSMIGDQYMDVLSRFDRAIEMYRAALEVDPANREILDRLAIAEARQFVDPVAFDEVEEGMIEADVQDILGLPREDWIKHQTRNNRLYSVWIYPKEDGGAAAIYFERGMVYHKNWDAAKRGGE